MISIVQSISSSDLEPSQIADGVNLASMKDVAKLAHVSVSTVSRVINKTVPVDARTRSQVERAIRRLDFKPNLLARGLRSKSGHLIGLAVPELLHPALSAFVNYVEESVRGEGLQCIVGNTRNDLGIEADFIESLIRRHVDGIIFSRVSDESRVLRVLSKNHVPMVVIDRALDSEGVPTVVLDNYRAGELAAEHLIGLGHRRIACISGSPKIHLSRERVSGFRDALRRHGMDLPDSHLHEGDFGYETGIEGIGKFLASGVEMTAVWGMSDLAALGAVAELGRRQRSVPRDVSVIGTDDIEFARMSFPALTTVRQPFQEMCRRAVDLIMAQVRGKRPASMRVVLAPELVIRESTRAV
jgi:DNA-binding LacI/PurR family transcriptional regulator